MVLFFVICCFLAFLSQGFSQDIEYPKIEEALHLSGNNAAVTEFLPLLAPHTCGENMYLYPGPGIKSTWSCDCKPGYLYFPQNGTCHAAYRQGPCSPGYYVHLPSNSAVPECIENSCGIDGVVPYMGSCHKLGDSGPACPHGKLKVDLMTYRLECITVYDKKRN